MQDSAITAIGRATGKVSDRKYENYVQDMFPGQEYFMLLMDFSLADGSAVFQEIDVDTVSSSNHKQYGYRKGSSRGGDITFTTKVGTIEKKFATFQKQLEKFVKLARTEGFEEDVRVFEAVRGCVLKQAESIKTSLTDSLESFSKEEQHKCGFSVRVEEGGTKKYLTEFPTAQRQLILAGTEGKSKKHSVRSEAKNKVCSICLEQKPLIHGFGSPLKYATVDKPGLVSGFFNQGNNWKNYPICSDCAFDFEMGRDYVFQHLRQSFYGRFYFVVPQTIFDSSVELLKKVLKRLRGIEYQPTSDKITKMVSREDMIMAALGREFGEEENRLTLNLLFFEENQTTKAMKIKLALEEVLPSRFRRLFHTVPQMVNDHPLYRDVISYKKERYDLQFSFGLFRDFFDDNFLDIVYTVFTGQPISQNLLYSRFMERIRKNYVAKQAGENYESTSLTLAKAHLVLRYLDALGIIHLPINKYRMQESNSALSDPPENEQDQKKTTFNREVFDHFVTENNDFLGSDMKIGLFALGVFVRFVFDQQYRMLGNTPFQKKLHGYRLDPDKIRAIYLEALTKARQYSNFSAYKNLREGVLNEYFVPHVPQLKNLSNDELSFYFVAGLEMGRQFKNKKETTETE